MLRVLLTAVALLGAVVVGLIVSQAALKSGVELSRSRMDGAIPESAGRSVLAPDDGRESRWTDGAEGRRDAVHFPDPDMDGFIGRVSLPMESSGADPLVQVRISSDARLVENATDATEEFVFDRFRIADGSAAEASALASDLTDCVGFEWRMSVPEEDLVVAEVLVDGVTWKIAGGARISKGSTRAVVDLVPPTHGRLILLPTSIASDGSSTRVFERVEIPRDREVTLDVDLGFEDVEVGDAANLPVERNTQEVGRLLLDDQGSHFSIASRPYARVLRILRPGYRMVDVAWPAGDHEHTEQLTPLSSVTVDIVGSGPSDRTVDVELLFQGETDVRWKNVEIPSTIESAAAPVGDAVLRAVRAGPLGPTQIAAQNVRLRHGANQVRFDVGDLGRRGALSVTLSGIDLDFARAHEAELLIRRVDGSAFAGPAPSRTPLAQLPFEDGSFTADVRNLWEGEIEVSVAPFGVAQQVGIRADETSAAFIDLAGLAEVHIWPVDLELVGGPSRMKDRLFVQPVPSESDSAVVGSGLPIGGTYGPFRPKWTDGHWVVRCRPGDYAIGVLPLSAPQPNWAPPRVHSVHPARNDLAVHLGDDPFVEVEIEFVDDSRSAREALLAAERDGRFATSSGRALPFFASSIATGRVGRASFTKVHGYIPSDGMVFAAPMGDDGGAPRELTTDERGVLVFRAE